MITKEYRVSERSVLVPGTAFRTSGGPVYRFADGHEEAMAAKGPFAFLWAEIDGDLVFIHAIDKSGNHAILHVEGERKQPFPGLIPNPYKIKNRMRKGLSKVRGLRKGAKKCRRKSSAAT
jgi:hypothetical protein